MHLSGHPDVETDGFFCRAFLRIGNKSYAGSLSKYSRLKSKYKNVHEDEDFKIQDSITNKSFLVKSGSVFSSSKLCLCSIFVGLYQYTPVLMSCLMGEQQGLVFYPVVVRVYSSMTVTGASRWDLKIPLKIASGFCSCGGVDALQSPGSLS